MFDMTKKNNTHRRSGNTDDRRFAPTYFRAVLGCVFFKLAIKFFRATVVSLLNQDIVMLFKSGI